VAARKGLRGRFLPTQSASAHKMPIQPRHAEPAAGL